MTVVTSPRHGYDSPMMHRCSRPLTLLALAVALLSCPKPSLPNSSGGFPLVLEGFRLGTPMAEALAALRHDGWQEERIARPGGRIIEVRGRHPDHPRLRYLRLNFGDGYLLSVRVGFRAKLLAEGRDLAKACAAGTIVGGGGLYVQCYSKDEKVALFAQRSGERVTLIDVPRATDVGILATGTVSELVRKAASRDGGAPELTLGGGKASGPLLRVHENVQLGEQRSDVLARFQPPVWQLRTLSRERRGVRYRHVQLRTTSHPKLSEMLLDFDEETNLLVRARFFYKERDAARAAELSTRCQGHLIVPVRVNHEACRQGWETMLSFHNKGRNVELLELTRVLTTGLFAREEIDPNAPPPAATSGQ